MPLPGIWFVVDMWEWDDLDWWNSTSHGDLEVEVDYEFKRICFRLHLAP